MQIWWCSRLRWQEVRQESGNTSYLQCFRDDVQKILVGRTHFVESKGKPVCVQS